MSMSTQAYFNMNKKIVTILCIKFLNQPFLWNAILIEHMLFMLVVSCIHQWNRKLFRNWQRHNFNIQGRTFL